MSAKKKLKRQAIKMDNLKKATIKDYTAWDLNCPRFIRVKNRQKLEAIFKRKARRKAKQKLKKEIEK
jgi:hypothetical protein